MGPWTHTKRSLCRLGFSGPVTSRNSHWALCSHILPPAWLSLLWEETQGQGCGTQGVWFFLTSPGHYLTLWPSPTSGLSFILSFYLCWFCCLEYNGTFWNILPSPSLLLPPQECQAADLTCIHVDGLPSVLLPGGTALDPASSDPTWSALLQVTCRSRA